MYIILQTSKYYVRVGIAVQGGHGDHDFSYHISRKSLFIFFFYIEFFFGYSVKKPLVSVTRMNAVQTRFEILRK